MHKELAVRTNLVKLLLVQTVHIFVAMYNCRQKSSTLHLFADKWFLSSPPPPHISTLFWGAGGLKKLNTDFSLQTTLPQDGILLSVPTTFDDNNIIVAVKKQVFISSKFVLV